MFSEIEDVDAVELQNEKAKRFLSDRQVAYKRAFDNPDNTVALEDLKAFCRAETSTFHPDPRMHAVLEGRREVWLRIQDHLKLDPDTLWQKQTGKGTT